VGNQDHFPKKKNEREQSRHCSKTCPSNIPNSRCFHPYIRQPQQSFGAKALSCGLAWFLSISWDFITSKYKNRNFEFFYELIISKLN